ncbi:MAG: cache domain-containing protein [Prochloraceae cyanobacterium]
MSRTKKINKLITLLAITLIGVGIDFWRINEEKKENIKLISIELNSVSEGIKRWDLMNVLALKNLSSQSDIISMNPKLQRGVLKRLVENYPQFYLAFTMNRDGVNIARSDNNNPKDYSNREYFRRILLGEKLVYQSLIGRSNKQPTLCMAAAIEQGKNLLGLSAICSNLESLSREIGSLNFGRTGSVFLVDRDGNLLAHPNSSYLRGEELRDVSKFAPVKNMLEGRLGEFIYFDDEGKKWFSLSNRINQEWGIVIVAEHSELVPRSYWQIIVSVSLIIGIFLILKWQFDFSKNNSQDNQNNKDKSTNNSPRSVRPSSSNTNVRVSRSSPQPERGKIQDNSRQLNHDNQKNNLAKIRENQTILKRKKIVKNQSDSVNGRGRILIVHSDPSKQKYYSSLLIKLGFMVTTASDGESGLKTAISQPFDMIITNLFLARLSGKVMVKQLRSIQFYSKTPIIGILSNYKLLEKPDILDIFDDCLEEPICKEKLMLVLQKYLNSASNSERVIQFPQQKIKKIN